MVLRLYVHIDETQSLFLAFDLYIIIMPALMFKKFWFIGFSICHFHSVDYCADKRMSASEKG